MSYLAKVKAQFPSEQAEPSPLTASEWQYKYVERTGIIAEDTHNTLSVCAERLAWLETLVEYLQSQHKGIIAQFKILVNPKTH